MRRAGTVAAGERERERGMDLAFIENFSLVTDIESVQSADFAFSLFMLRSTGMHATYDSWKHCID